MFTDPKRIILTRDIIIPAANQYVSTGSYYIALQLTIQNTLSISEEYQTYMRKRSSIFWKEDCSKFYWLSYFSLSPVNIFFLKCSQTMFG